MLCPLRPPGSCRPGARRSLPGALSGPAGGLSFRFLLCNTKVAKAAAQQSRSAARGSPTGRWRRARARTQAATRAPGGAARREGRAEEAARPPARPGPPRARGPRPLRPRAGSPGPWCTCSARGASGARRPAPCLPAPTQPAGPARPGRRAPRRPRSLRRDAALGGPGRGRRGQGARGLPQRAAAPGGRPDGPAAAPLPARGPP